MQSTREYVMDTGSSTVQEVAGEVRWDIAGVASVAEPSTDNVGVPS